MIRGATQQNMTALLAPQPVVQPLLWRSRMQTLLWRLTICPAQGCVLISVGHHQSTVCTSSCCTSESGHDKLAAGLRVHVCLPHEPNSSVSVVVLAILLGCFACCFAQEAVYAQILLYRTDHYVSVNAVQTAAALCGLYAYRPTRGAISKQGVTPIAGDVDEVSWICRSAAMLPRLGQAFKLPGGQSASRCPLMRNILTLVAAFCLVFTNRCSDTHICLQACCQNLYYCQILSRKQTTKLNPLSQLLILPNRHNVQDRIGQADNCSRFVWAVG